MHSDTPMISNYIVARMQQLLPHKAARTGTANGVEINHPTYQEKQLIWRMMRDVYAGEDSIKRMGEYYLPKPCGQSRAEYENYLARARFPDVLSRTVDGYCGRIFRKSYTAQLPERMKEILDQMDASTLPFEAMLRALVRDIAVVGRQLLLLDWCEERNHPIILRYQPEQIVNWKTDSKGRLTLLVIETALESSDSFSHDTSLRRTVYSLNEAGEYHVVHYDKDSQKGWQATQEITPLIAGKTLNAIPAVFVSANGLSIDIEKPVLYGLAAANLHFYHTSADRRQALYLTAQPTPYIAGGDKIYDTGHDFYGCACPADKQAEYTVHIGSSRMLLLPEGASVGFAEISGSGLAEQRLELQDLRDEMAALGARILRDPGQNNIAAETERLQQGGETSVLAGIARNVSAAIEQLLRMASGWMYLPEQEISLSLNTQFFDTPLSPQALNELVAAWQAGAFDKEVLDKHLERGELL